MKPPINLVLGRPRVALAPSRLLSGEVTTPYGAMPSEEAVSTAWRRLAGDVEPPPWIVLGRRDAPSGTIWGLAWCPPTGALPEDAEIVLPEAAWALENLDEIQGPETWHLRRLHSPSGVWLSVWEGSRCEHLRPPSKDPAQIEPLERAIAARRGAVDLSEFEATWHPPSPDRLWMLSESAPESDLLPVTDSVRRRDRRSTRVALARVVAVLIVLAVVTGGFGLFQLWHAHQRRTEEMRLDSVRVLVDRTSSLESSRQHLIDSLRTFREALRRSEATDLVVARLAAKIPSTARLQVLALEEIPGGWRVRTEARLPDWSSIQPFAQALRTIEGVSKVSIANQVRQSDAVSAILEIEGTWP